MKGEKMDRKRRGMKEEKKKNKNRELKFRGDFDR